MGPVPRLGTEFEMNHSRLQAEKRVIKVEGAQYPPTKRAPSPPEVTPDGGGLSHQGVQQEEGNEMGLSIFKAWRVRATNDAVRIEIEAKLGDHGMTSSYTTAMNLNVELPDENSMIEFIGQIINIHVKDVQHRIRHMMLADLLRGAGARIEMFEASPMPDTEWGQTQDQSQMPENISEPGEYAAQALMDMIEQMKKGDPSAA